MLNDAFGYDPKLPDNLREIFVWLCQDVAALREKWSFYLELFGSEENTDLLSELVLASFQIIEEALRNDIILSICRLSDPIKSLGYENLSFETLKPLVKELSLPDNTSKLFEDFQSACELVQKYRNKRVGHNDLNTRIKPQDNPLQGIGRDRIDQIIQLAEQILNLVYQHFVGGELVFESDPLGGADALIFWLKTAKEYEAAKKQALLGHAA